LLDAKAGAMKLIESTVVKQSTLLSYKDAYFMIGILFAITLPLLIFVAGRRKQMAPGVVISDH